MNIHIGDVSAYAHFIVTTAPRSGEALMVGFFDRSKIKIQSMVQNLGRLNLTWGWTRFDTKEGREAEHWTGLMQSISLGRDRFTYCYANSERVGKRYVLCTPATEDEVIYDYLMNSYKLPLLKWWVPAIKEALIKGYTLRQVTLYKKEGKPIGEGDCAGIFVPLNGETVCLKDVIGYDFGSVTNDILTGTVSDLLRKGAIWITKKQMAPLKFETFDDYIRMYGPSLVDNLEKALQPLSPLVPNVPTLALKGKSLYPQQAASVNGILAMKRNGIKYAVMNQGMGVGKTLQALSAVEGASVEEWLRRHPGATLRDAYATDNVSYRVIVMAPGHLVAKWAEEIEAEIPYAKATVIKRLSQLEAIREEGVKPHGKQFYIISKDSAKLDTQASPIPYRVSKKPISLAICKDCYEDEDNPRISYKKGKGQDAICPTCKGKNFMPFQEGTERHYGMVCPCCGELLIRNKGYNKEASDFDEKIAQAPLKPADFATKCDGNSQCYHCGAALWGVNAKPLITGNGTAREPKWYRVSHWKNHTHKSRDTAFVLRGHEKEYEATCVTLAGMRKVAQEYGPRRTSLAAFVKKHLKGYFDFCILDECHKYLGESAQAVAAHQLVKASKFSLGLTGTISNGTATAFYNLFWLFEPKKLLDMGYTYSASECARFCKEYGCVEQVFECSSSSVTGSSNLMSRGKALGAPKVKPGISPVLYGKLLMDRCLFLDITDMSKYLPRFSERVETVGIPDELSWDYNHVIETLKEESQSGKGMSVLSVMLQFGLSYLDKPYGRLPIMDPYKEDALIVRPKNHDEFAQPDLLLPKEEKLVEIINQEIGEDRNCFVYASFTGKEEANVTYRLKELIESRCNLRGRVEIIQSSSPAASKREEWFHKRAAEGIKVFITNPQNVETGLDFCFKHNGQYYNYPTLIFYQTGYNLSVIWQASRRAFRLNQRQECRNYYLAYDRTLQSSALEIMAKKQVATAAIQGCFSTEGLSAMAQGVDARAQLAASLSKGDMTSRDTLENMFDVLNANRVVDDGYSGFVPSPSFYDLVGGTDGFDGFSVESLIVEEADESAEVSFEGFGTFGSFEGFGSFGDETTESFGGFEGFFEETVVEDVTPVTTSQQKKRKKKASNEELMGSIFDLLAV